MAARKYRVGRERSQDKNMDYAGPVHSLVTHFLPHAPPPDSTVSYELIDELIPVRLAAHDPIISSKHQLCSMRCLGDILDLNHNRRTHDLFEYGRGT